MTDAVVLDLADGRVYHFKHGWIPLDHIGRERLRAHGVNPDGHNVVHGGKVVANYRTKREAIAHADRLNGFSGTGSATVRGAGPSGARPKARTSARTLATRMPADGRDKAAPPRAAHGTSNPKQASPTGAQIMAATERGQISRRQADRLAAKHGVTLPAATRSPGPATGRSVIVAPARRDGTLPSDDSLQNRADAAVRMKAPELRVLAASGDKVAQAELERRAAKAELSRRHNNPSEQHQRTIFSRMTDAELDAAAKRQQRSPWMSRLIADEKTARRKGNLP